MYFSLQPSAFFTCKKHPPPHFIRSKEETYKPDGERVDCGEGVGGGHSTDETMEHNVAEGRTPASFISSKEVRVSECRKTG